MTDFVCHTAPLENAIQIFKSGSLLSAVNARKLPDTILHFIHSCIYTNIVEWLINVFEESY